MFCLDLVRYLSIKKSIEVNPPRSDIHELFSTTISSKCQTVKKVFLSCKENLCDDKWLRKESSSAPLTSSGHLFTTVSDFGWMHPFTLEAPGKAPFLDLAKSSLSIFHLFQHFGSFGVPSVCF